MIHSSAIDKKCYGCSQRRYPPFPLDILLSISYHFYECFANGYHAISGPSRRSRVRFVHPSMASIAHFPPPPAFTRCSMTPGGTRTARLTVYALTRSIGRLPRLIAQPLSPQWFIIDGSTPGVPRLKRQPAMKPPLHLAPCFERAAISPVTHCYSQRLGLMHSYVPQHHIVALLGRLQTAPNHTLTSLWGRGWSL